MDGYGSEHEDYGDFDTFHGDPHPDTINLVSESPPPQEAAAAPSPPPQDAPAPPDFEASPEPVDLDWLRDEFPENYGTPDNLADLPALEGSTEPSTAQVLEDVHALGPPVSMDDLRSDESFQHSFGEDDHGQQLAGEIHRLSGERDEAEAKFDVFEEQW